ncbi:MAG: transcriptional repressor [Candidatus Auribacterota bacterium]|nr:transcriptional repressor [Candidatus Auribacterota bacterium]
MDKFEEICRKHDLRITPQRVAIYRELTGDKSHPTADMIYRRMRKIFPFISFDTVNRTLNTFAQIGLIDSVECSGRGSRYDPNTERHHHLRCIQCNKISDFYDSSLDKIEIPKHVHEGFTVLNTSVVLTGICINCSKKGDSNGNKR